MFEEEELKERGELKEGEEPKAEAEKEKKTITKKILGWGISQ